MSWAYVCKHLKIFLPVWFILLLGLLCGDPGSQENCYLIAKARRERWLLLHCLQPTFTENSPVRAFVSWRLTWMSQAVYTLIQLKLIVNFFPPGKLILLENCIWKQDHYSSLTETCIEYQPALLFLQGWLSFFHKSSGLEFCAPHTYCSLVGLKQTSAEPLLRS